MKKMISKNKKTKEKDSSELLDIRINKQQQEEIDKLILLMASLKALQEDIKSKTEEIASQIGIKPAILKSRVSLIEKESASGDVIKKREIDNNFVSFYFKVKNNEVTDNNDNEVKDKHEN